MSIITQNPYIFNFSIKDNLLLAKEDATMKEIRNACKLACIDDYIMTLPDKYDTILGENGVILSGGQKQRLAIARALLMKTEIILFDEATSALDNETQSKIQEAINNLKGEYTILIVAHRLTSVIDCDRIFVVDDGKIIDQGTHKELMKKSSFYKNLYNKESGEVND
jgi:ABC-type multidrug transport system fused ATPase/permease subunit